jgi:ATP-dependent RNA helicase DeaD
MSEFVDLGIGRDIAKAVEEMGWTEPTPIQVEAVPAGLTGRDIFAQAQTGTGKTGTYAMIVLGRTSSGSRIPTVLVLAPTRELAVQVDREFRKLTKYTRHFSTPVYGGASIRDQLYMLEKGTDIVVGTPGRVKDMIERGALDLSAITEVVLDEADRMFDMGFSEELDFIMNAVPEERQTLLFSATMAPEIKDLAFSSMKDPLEISVSKDEMVSDLTSQYYVQVSKSGKLGRLEAILANGNPKTIVFCQTKSMVDELADKLSEGFKVDSIHGDMPQIRRERVIRNFRNNRFLVLIATDVAARGLDVSDVDCVVNYDVPPDAETYLHRIGRTGRAGKEGMAISFVTRYEDRRIGMYERETGKPIAKVRIEDMEPMTFVHEEPVREPVRERRVFADRPPRQERRVDVRREERPKVGKNDGMTAIQIGLGKEDGFGRTQIVEFVKKNADVPEGRIGRVGLGSSTSFVEIGTEVVDSVVESLLGSKREGRNVSVRIAPKKTPYAERMAAKGSNQARRAEIQSA